MRQWGLIVGSGWLAGVLLGASLVRWRWVRWAQRQRLNPWAGRRAREWAQAWRAEP
jgi:hypothetical protein